MRGKLKVKRNGNFEEIKTYPNEEDYIRKKDSLPERTDLNTVTDTGFYVYYHTTVPINGNNSLAFVLTVKKYFTGYIFQEMQTWDDRFFVRSCWHGTWHAWKEK